MFESFTCKDKPYQPQNFDFQKPTFGALRRSACKQIGLRSTLASF